MTEAKKKGAVGPFEVWRVGKSLYEVRRAGETLRRVNGGVNAAYAAASQFHRNQRFADQVAAEINRGEV